MSTIGKKKINQITLKKLAPERLIKCYVCNKLFNTQNQFSEHLQQHQSKLNRTNIEEIQRKTHQSFRSKKQSSNILRTTSTNQKFESKTSKEGQKEENNNYKDIEMEKQDEKQMQIALKQSQIMLQRIQFLTQINFQENQSQIIKFKQEQQALQIEKTIDNQKILYRQLSDRNNNRPQNLILATNFQIKYFENYQQQLRHLKNLAYLSINSSSIAKIQAIIRKICEDIYKDLQKLYKQQSIQKKGKEKESALDFWVQEAKSQLYFCSECYSEVQMGKQFYLNSSKRAYHVECFKQIFQ